MAVRAKVALKVNDLVSIVVNVETAVGEEVSDLHAVCTQGHDPVQVKGFMECPTCAKRASSHYGFAKGREVDGRMVVVDRQELAATAPGPEVKDQMVLTPHPLAEVLASTLPGAKMYFLSPGKTSAEGYVVLRDFLRTHPNVALLTEFAPRSKAGMWRIGVYGEALTLEQLCWPEDVRAAPAVPQIEYNPMNLTFISTYLESTVVAFDPTKYQDTARAAREALIASKVDEAVPLQPLPGANVPVTGGVGLLEALQASVANLVPAKSEPKKRAPRKRTPKLVAESA